MGLPIHSTHSSSKALADGKCTKEDDIVSLVAAKPNMLVVNAGCPFASASKSVLSPSVSEAMTAPPTSVTSPLPASAAAAAVAAPSSGEALKKIIDGSQAKGDALTAEDYMRLAEEAERWIASQ
jgi:hypothetical protein